MVDKKKKSKLKTRWNWLKSIIAIVISLFFFAPFYIILSLSFKSRADRTSYWLFPENPTFDAYAYALDKGDIWLAICNTLIVTVFSVVLVLVLGSIAAYPLARHKTRMNKLILSAFVGVMMVPPLSVLLGYHSSNGDLQFTYLRIHVHKLYRWNSERT